MYYRYHKENSAGLIIIFIIVNFVSCNNGFGSGNEKEILNMYQSDTEVTTELIIRDRESTYTPKYNENSSIFTNVRTLTEIG